MQKPDYKTLQAEAREKLRASGYCAFVLRNLVKRPFHKANNLENNYGIVYGAVLAPLSIEAFAKEAYATKEKEDFIIWLSHHGGKINFSVVNTGEKSTVRWANKYRKFAEKEGVLLPDDKAWLCIAILIEPEIDVYMSEEVQPEMYEQFRQMLAAYIADETNVQ